MVKGITTNGCSTKPDLPCQGQDQTWNMKWGHPVDAPNSFDSLKVSEHSGPVEEAHPSPH